MPCHLVFEYYTRSNVKTLQSVNASDPDDLRNFFTMASKVEVIIVLLKVRVTKPTDDLLRFLQCLDYENLKFVFLHELRIETEMNKQNFEIIKEYMIDFILKCSPNMGYSEKLLDDIVSGYYAYTVLPELRTRFQVKEDMFERPENDGYKTTEYVTKEEDAQNEIKVTSKMKNIVVEDLNRMIDFSNDKFMWLLRSLDPLIDNVESVLNLIYERSVNTKSPQRVYECSIKSPFLTKNPNTGLYNILSDLPTKYPILGPKDQEFGTSFHTILYPLVDGSSVKYGDKQGSQINIKKYNNIISLVKKLNEAQTRDYKRILSVVKAPKWAVGEANEISKKFEMQIDREYGIALLVSEMKSFQDKTDVVFEKTPDYKIHLANYKALLGGQIHSDMEYKLKSNIMFVLPLVFVIWSLHYMFSFLIIVDDELTEIFDFAKKQMAVLAAPSTTVTLSTSPPTTTTATPYIPPITTTSTYTPPVVTTVIDVTSILEDENKEIEERYSRLKEEQAEIDKIVIKDYEELENLKKERDVIEEKINNLDVLEDATLLQKELSEKEKEIDALDEKSKKIKEKEKNVTAELGKLELDKEEEEKKVKDEEEKIEKEKELEEYQQNLKEKIRNLNENILTLYDNKKRIKDSLGIPNPDMSEVFKNDLIEKMTNKIDKLEDEDEKLNKEYAENAEKIKISDELKQKELKEQEEEEERLIQLVTTFFDTMKDIESSIKDVSREIKEETKKAASALESQEELLARLKKIQKSKTLLEKQKEVNDLEKEIETLTKLKEPDIEGSVEITGQGDVEKIRNANVKRLKFTVFLLEKLLVKIGKNLQKMQQRIKECETKITQGNKLIDFYKKKVTETNIESEFDDFNNRIATEETEIQKLNDKIKGIQDHIKKEEESFIQETEKLKELKVYLKNLKSEESQVFIEANVLAKTNTVNDDDELKIEEGEEEEEKKSSSNGSVFLFGDTNDSY